MKWNLKFILLLFISLFSTGIFAANSSGLTDNTADMTSVSEISNALTKGLKTDRDKLKAFYSWICNNIAYDVVGINPIESYANDSKTLAEEALRTKRAYCSHYTALFKELCNVAGISCFIIEGYVRLNNGNLSYAGHSWNAVFIDNQYYNIDTTWGAGYVDSNNSFVARYDEGYFMPANADFFKNHMPLDPVWQFSTNPISFKDFDSNNFEKSQIPAKFNFNDSIKSLNKSTPNNLLNRKIYRICSLQGGNSYTEKRIKNLRATNDLEKTKADRVQVKNAINILNKVVEEYNNYISKYNNQSVSGSNREQKKLLLDMEQEIKDAGAIISSIKTTDTSLSKKIAELRNSVNQKLEMVVIQIQRLSN